MIKHLAMDPAHVGIIVIMMLVVGSVTPPVGILAMVACKIAGVEYNKTFGMLAPYTGAWMVVVVLVVFNPWMVTWLPSLVMK
jgi:C4-dicarboxylate transporter DctM subunit